jgi:hypothetical protein
MLGKGLGVKAPGLKARLGAGVGGISWECPRNCSPGRWPRPVGDKPPLGQSRSSRDLVILPQMVETQVFRTQRMKGREDKEMDNKTCGQSSRVGQAERGKILEGKRSAGCET